MHSPIELGRRIISAQDNLRAARRDGRYDDIVTWRARVDELLDEWNQIAPQPRENA
jgi:hypothetical protein